MRTTLESLRSYANDRIVQGKLLRRMVEEGLLSGREKIAVTGAGALRVMTTSRRKATSQGVALRSPLHHRGIALNPTWAAPETESNASPPSRSHGILAFRAKHGTGPEA